ncbi:hypothetical protein KR222_000972, partial [Zaprionus bogoriensis]
EQEILREVNADTKAATLSKLVCSSCDAAMVRKQHGQNRRRPAIWWSQDIEEARRGCIKARRKLTRNRDETRREAFQLSYKTARRELKRQIKASKAAHFRTLLEDMNVTPWGGAYKAVMRKL